MFVFSSFAYINLINVMQEEQNKKARNANDE